MNNRDVNKVLFYCPRIYPCVTGGMEVYSFSLFCQLKIAYPDLQFFLLSSCKSKKLKSLFYFDRLFVTKRYGLGTLSTLLVSLLFSINKWRKFDLIYIPYTDGFRYNAISFLLVKYFLNIDYVIHIHSGGLKEWSPKWLQKIFFKKARMILGVSIPIVKEYSHRSKRSVFYMPPLLPFIESSHTKLSARAELGLHEFSKIILFVGSLKRLKNPDILLEAFMKLNSDLIIKERVGLVFVGDGYLKSELLFRSEQFGFNDRVIFTGLVKNSEVKDYYKAADFYVIPSSYEGTPISLLEAFYNRLICIGSNVSGINSIIKDYETGLLFENGDINGLKSILEDVITNYSNINFGQSAYDHFSNKHSYQYHLEEIVNVFGYGKSKSQNQKDSCI